jgi:hypothetical protein
MPVERIGRYITAEPETLNRWLASEAHSPESIHIAHSGERDLVSDLKRGLALARKHTHAHQKHA